MPPSLQRMLLSWILVSLWCLLKSAWIQMYKSYTYNGEPLIYIHMYIDCLLRPSYATLLSIAHLTHCCLICTLALALALILVRGSSILLIFLILCLPLDSRFCIPFVSVTDTWPYSTIWLQGCLASWLWLSQATTTQIQMLLSSNMKKQADLSRYYYFIVFNICQ